MKILILCLILSSLNYYKTSQVKTVYVIPHSHDDVGWIRTIDSYYYGVDKDKKNVGVKYILNSIYRELQLNEDFKFIYSEMAFFTKWWNEQTSLTKENVKKLVKQRRLQFVGGGYVMNDEATTYYSDIIDQMTLGHEFIKNTFGVEAVPTIAWQIDPFGHSVSSIEIFAGMKMDHLILYRIPKYFEMLLSQQNIIDFLWKSKVSNQSIITHYLTEKYSQPSELDFFVKAPIVDDPKSDLYNLDTKLEYFIKHCDLLLQKTNLAKSPFPFGDDFKYENANIIAENIIKLVKYGNEQAIQRGTNIQYVISTAREYTESFSHDSLKTFTDDLFPLIDKDNIWTGFYTSRPDLKRQTRLLSILHNNVRSLEAQVTLKFGLREIWTSNTLHQISETLAIMQHHDAITGTSVQNTYLDYMKRIKNAIKLCFDLYHHLIKKNFDRTYSARYCHEKILDSNSSIYIYNNQIQERKVIVRIKIDTSHDYSLIANRVKLQFSIINFNGIPEIFFIYTIPPLTWQYFVIVKQLDHRLIRTKRQATINVFKLNTMDDICDYIYIKRIKEMLCHNNKYTFTQIGHYVPNKYSYASGHYTFNLENMIFHDYKTKMKINLYRHRYFDEFYINYNSWIKQTLRITKESESFEIDWKIGRIPLNDGKEIVVKYFTKIKNEHFYTSNNGLVTVQRKYDKYKKYEENFFPITNSIYITNNLESLAILVDRSVGGTSPTAGQVDILIHRNLRHHDNLGIWESLRDNTIINTRHTFFINENVENIPLLNQIVYNEAQSICMDGIRNFTKLTPFTSEFYVHKNIHLLTFQMLGQRLLMRFQFFSGKDLAFIENICPQKIFNYLKIRNMYETSLNAAHIIEIIQKHKEGYCFQIKMGEIKTILIDLE